MKVGMAKVTGVQKVIANAKKAYGKIGKGVVIGMRKGGLFLQRESQQIVPVQMAELKNSAFTRAIGAGIRTDVIVGYTAGHAAYVHEDPDKAHGKEFNMKHANEIAHAKADKLKAGTAAGGMFKRGENQQFKFLEKPARDNRHKILKLIASEASKT